ncbi:MAG TPA: SMP-30/gluconolactonase/LRE family protein [Steroidobacteraceae bacterium]|nr:SMP-30/gluconolactonase/LRE family protein [Steroidobacteraceae bacterium]
MKHHRGLTLFGSTALGFAAILLVGSGSEPASAQTQAQVLAQAGLQPTQAPPPSDHPVVRLDPALDELLSPDAKLEVVKDGFGFTEGTQWIQHGRRGYLVFSDIPYNVIYKMTADGNATVLLNNSGYAGPWNGYMMLTAGGAFGRAYVQIGSNGLAIDPQGRIVICRFGARDIVRLEKNGKLTELADNYEGRKFNGPDDVVVKHDGAIYFTDTFYGLRSNNAANKGIDFMGVFMIKDGKLSLVINDVKNTNGLAFSPDEKYLYVNGSQDKYIKRYEVQPDDTVTHGTMLIDMHEDKAPGITDGMRVDARGNIWSSGPGGIWVISPQGRHLGTILLPQTAANVSFGDPDWKSLYVAARGTIYRIRTLSVGQPCPTCTGPR